MNRESKTCHIFFSYRAQVLSAQHRRELADLRLQRRELIRAQHLRLARQRNAAVRHGRLIRLRQDTLSLQNLVQMLAHDRMGPIGADEDVALEDGAVAAAGNDIVVVVIERQDVLVQVHLVLGELGQEQGGKVGFAEDVFLVSGTKRPNKDLNVRQYEWRGGRGKGWIMGKRHIRFVDPAAVLDQLGGEVLVEQLQLCVGLPQLLELVVDAELLEQGRDACTEGDGAYGNKKIES